MNNESFNFKVDPHQFNLRLHHFSQFQRKGRKKIQKLADLWLVGEMVNRIGIYGSKVAEGLSAFQHRSCLNLLVRTLPFYNLPSCLYIRNIVPVLQYEYYIWVFHHLIIITKKILCSSKKEIISSSKMTAQNENGYSVRFLTLKHWEMHACLLNTVATDAMVLKHQAISSHSADEISIVLGQFHTKV